MVDPNPLKISGQSGVPVAARVRHFAFNSASSISARMW
jgi:hypothetical protein